MANLIRITTPCVALSCLIPRKKKKERVREKSEKKENGKRKKKKEKKSREGDSVDLLPPGPTPNLFLAKRHYYSLVQL